jgi:hypothetical protein
VAGDGIQNTDGAIFQVEVANRNLAPKQLPEFHHCSSYEERGLQRFALIA